MRGFQGTATNKLDAKGRVSVPAIFRALIEADGRAALYCYPSLSHAAIDAGAARLLQEVDETIARFQPYSNENEDLSYTLIADSCELPIDSEGRILLPESLRAHAGVAASVTFVGLGSRFQMWEPKAWTQHLVRVRKRARTHLSRMHAKPDANPQRGAS